MLYVIYTSGSTGKPKGVMIEHRNMVNLIYFQNNKTNIHFKGNVLQYATSSFDVCYQEIFSTLLDGGTLHVLPTEIKTNIPELLRFIKNNQVSTIFLPTAFFKLFIQDEKYVNQIPDTVKDIVTAGEKLLLNDRALNQLMDKGIVVHNHYGPSETHVVTTYSIVDGNPNENLSPPIGKPIANTKIYIVDDNDNLQPIGVPGEILIEGDCVGRGYIHNAHLTTTRFEVIEKLSQNVVYRTGDIGRWLHDGNIAYIGRKDHQLKIRGYRIEPDEIEQVLVKHHSIKDAVVLSRNPNHLSAFIVVSDVEMNLEPEIKQFLQGLLPSYMIPQEFHLLSEMPFTPNGKIDKNRLLQLKRPALNHAGRSAPLNELEKLLQSIWGNVLNLDEVNIDDNFFEIGGHSLQAVRLDIEMSKYNLPTGNLLVYENKTIREMAETLSKRIVQNPGFEGESVG